MRARSIAVALLLLTSAMLGRAETPSDVLPAVDFQAFFPYLAWVSTEGRDEKHPDGVRFALFSVRTADAQTVEFALIRELHDGTRSVALHARGPLAPFGETATALVKDFSRRYGIEFTRADLGEIRDVDEFRRRAAELGWELRP